MLRPDSENSWIFSIDLDWIRDKTTVELYALKAPVAVRLELDPELCILVYIADCQHGTRNKVIKNK